MDSQQELIKIIEEVFREQFLDEKLVITACTSPNDIEEWDSFAQISLLLALEKRFNIRFTADEMASIDSVAAILEALKRREK